MTNDQQDARKLHRRATLYAIVLPFAGGLLLIVVLMVIVGLQGRMPIAAVANTMLTVLILCPFALCLLPLYFALVIAVAGMSRAHGSIARPLRRLEELSLKLRERTTSASDRAARTTINLSARFAPLDKLIFSAFDRPAQPEDDHD